MNSEGWRPDGFRCGIEHELALVRPDGRFADFVNTNFCELQAMVGALPLYPSDYPGLRLGDLGVKVKRWYVEGYSRFGQTGEYVGWDPKGIEVRTPICGSVEAAASQVRDGVSLLSAVARGSGFQVVVTAHNPYRVRYQPSPELNAWERDRRQVSPEDVTAVMHMVTFGPDLNLSWDDLDEDLVVDAGMKLTYYSPFIVPFTFSSPFLDGRPWGGLSARTLTRTGARPAALVYLADTSRMIESAPSLTRMARIDDEVGRIEFKAFDACRDPGLYADLLTLLKGIVTDRRLVGRRVTPDAELHQMAARSGFDHPEIRSGADLVLTAAAEALHAPRDRRRITRLRARLERRECLARTMLERYRADGSLSLFVADPAGDAVHLRGPAP